MAAIPYHAVPSKIPRYQPYVCYPTPGLLQWVEATEPLNSYLVGRNHAGGAHMRYQPPGEWSWMQCYLVRA